MQRTMVVAVCGGKRCGKDEVGSLLCSNMGYHRLKFAGPLKDAMKALFDFSDEQLEGSTKEVADQRWGVTPRQAMQFFGTEVMQYKIQELLPGVDRTFFAKCVVATISSVIDRHPRIVITDMRFPHEERTLRQFCADRGIRMMTVRVDRPGLLAAERPDAHASEREYAEIRADVVLTNDGTIEQLRARVLDAFAST